jgi:lipoate-protein ligase A
MGRDSRSTASRQSPATIWRVLGDPGDRDPRANLALDEALARGAAPLTLRFWRNGRSVVLGRFQRAAAEVDLAVAEALRIPVLRRFTGGGAVFHDSGNLNITVVGHLGSAPFDAPAGLRLPALYRVVLDPLATVVAELGLAVERTDRDLLVNGRKITGVAAWIGRDRALVHATLLIDADLDALERVLAGPGAPGDIRWERTRSRRVPVTSLNQELGAIPELNSKPIEQRIVDAFGAADSREAPSPIECSRARQLLKQRYAVQAWHAGGIDPV